MKQIILNKDSKILYKYNGVEYLVENYESSECHNYSQKYLLYSVTPTKFLCFYYYPLLHHVFIDESIYSGNEEYESGVLKRNCVKRLIESYLENEKEKELIKLNIDNYEIGGEIK